MIIIQPQLVKTDVTCVKTYFNCILAAVGNTVQVFTKDGQQLQVYQIFSGQKIHGIVPNDTNKIAFFGGNLLKIFEFDFLITQISKELVCRQCEDWIFALEWVDSCTSIATIFAHNFISLWNVSNLSLAKRVGCKQKCILYSAKIVNNTWNSLYVFSGTVFGQVLIWNPASANCNFADVLYRLKGHNGAIFSIDYSSAYQRIVTTSDDRTVRFWEPNQDIFSDNSTKNNTEIVLRKTLYGHTARIFKCKIVSKYVVTAGEDSFVHVWNLDGRFIRKFETHQGGCVWALDTCLSAVSDFILTGGGDSGVNMNPRRLNYGIKILKIPPAYIPKVLKLTATGNTVIVSNNGQFKYFNKSLEKLESVDTYNDFGSYVIMEVSQNRKLIALAGFNGVIYIYKEHPEQILEFICEYKPDGNRIFALHWLTNSMFLTSTNDGIMNCWLITKQKEEYFLTKIEHNFILPQCKERWATCAALCDTNYLVVGDRKGNIHLYNLNTNDYIHTIKKAHCHLGVTNLTYIDNQLYSLGRSGMLNKYYLNTSESSLTKVTTDKLSFSWIASMEKLNDIIYLYGFSGSNFVVFNLNHRRIILETFCGGGHRSWDCMVTKSKLFYFDFIRDKEVNTYSEKWSNLSKSNIIDGYHTKEINCGSVIKIKDNFLVLSGGEDTTIRLSLYDKIKYKFDTFQTIKSHLSSVRCITHCFLKEIDCKKEFLIFSGGGRAQIIFQKLRINLGNNKIDCQQLHSYYKQLRDTDFETRIMNLVTITLENNILLIAGCSDGTLKCFKISKEKLTFEYLTEFKYKNKCVICLSYINICNNNIIISMGTDGKLVFWNFSDICSSIEKEITEPEVEFNLTPFFDLKTHQSGINSFDFRKLTDSKYIFVSGGDDNSIILNVTNFNFNGTGQIVNLLSQLILGDIHAAQVTGLFFNEKYLIATSVDQNITVFKYEIREHELTCDVLTQYCSSISDIQGMKCISEDKELLVFVFGKGIEICSIAEVDPNKLFHYIPFCNNHLLNNFC